MSVPTAPRVLAAVGKFLYRCVNLKPRLPWLFMLPRDVGLFLKSARTDAKIARLQREKGAGAAFEAIYAESDDPWASASPRYRYQRLKYDRLITLLPKQRFGNALDLGCGLGLLSQKLAKCAEHVLGMDISATAIGHARQRAAAFGNLEFEPGDILNLPPSLHEKFDLVVVSDVLYYLSPLDGPTLRSAVNHIADLLSPGGICLVANHYFFSGDPDSRVSRTIHRAFADCTRFSMMSEHRRPFFLATFFSMRPTSSELPSVGYGVAQAIP
ncbi:MAG TPA: class I SAM-dependent methyltransferase [Steroidobacteraceae bacterium]|jgi:SAM-dependent methyltransferase|nr:class I SAM-dependent methyltransferase [Steroidobacteraceae bacterium]